MLLLNRSLLCVVVLTLLSGCGGNSQEVPQSSSPFPLPTPANGDWYAPSSGTTWQWQLSGELNTQYAVDVYDVDLFDVSKAQISELQDKDIRVTAISRLAPMKPGVTMPRSFLPAHLATPWMAGKTNAGWISVIKAFLPSWKPVSHWPVKKAAMQ